MSLISASVKHKISFKHSNTFQIFNINTKNNYSNFNNISAYSINTQERHSWTESKYRQYEFDPPLYYYCFLLSNSLAFWALLISMCTSQWFHLLYAERFPCFIQLLWLNMSSLFNPAIPLNIYTRKRRSYFSVIIQNLEES